MPPPHSLVRAGRWFLESGIQNPQGGVSRFYRADVGKNKPISTEITGYAASALVYLYRVTGQLIYLDGARRAVAFLQSAWEPELNLFPFELPAPTDESEWRAYFFDTGIVIRGLIAVWRETKNDALIGLALRAAEGMKKHETGLPGEYFPILRLPSCEPLEPAGNWSGSAACYQTKSALAWWELAEISGNESLREAYLVAIQTALNSHRDFLPAAASRAEAMDRLHAYCYFLEALSPLLEREDCQAAYKWGISNVENYLREIEPEFVRSDVYAQLLRARLFARRFIPVDAAAAEAEARALESFQFVSEDSRLDGGFSFARRAGQTVPHANPVSTAFAVQALHLWHAHCEGLDNPCLLPPI